MPLSIFGKLIKWGWAILCDSPCLLIIIIYPSTLLKKSSQFAPKHVVWTLYRYIYNIILFYYWIYTHPHTHTPIYIYYIVCVYALWSVKGGRKEGRHGSGGVWAICCDDRCGGWVVYWLRVGGGGSGDVF